MPKQGCYLTEPEVNRIVELLAKTDMTLLQISQRMSCSRSTVVAVNRRFQIRKYEGVKTTWTLQARS